MQLKKINEKLQQRLMELGFTEANTLQQGVFGPIKSGVDVVVQSQKATGKSTTIALNVIQRLATSTEEESPRALVIVQDKPQVLEMVDLFNQLGKYNGLRVYGTHEKTDLDEDKNQISLGIDVLIGTPNRLNMMFSTAGYNVNRLQMFIVDDADILFKIRLDAAVKRISDSIAKVQRIFFCSKLTDRVEVLADKIMIEPLFLESE